MSFLLECLKKACAHNWEKGPASLGYVPQGKFQQYSCTPAHHWEKMSFALIFGETVTPLMSVRDLISYDAATKKIYLSYLLDTKPGTKSVLGMQLFRNNWVEFNLDSQHVRFSKPTSDKSHWGPWSLCPCGSGSGVKRIKTRQCDAGDGEWCSGPSSLPCTVTKCPKCLQNCNGQSCDFWLNLKRARSCEDLEHTQGCDCRGCSACTASTDGQLAWASWTACSATCGSGSNG